MNEKKVIHTTFPPKILISDWLLMLNEMEHQSRPNELKESYLKSYFNLMYYLLFVPFKIQVDSKSGEYMLKSNKIQKL